MAKGCYICSKGIDRVFLWSTPDGKKYKICGKCVNIVKTYAKSAEAEKETVEKDSD